jgi:hypothetical protein
VIVTIAHAKVPEATSKNLYGEWSNVVTGCYLVEAGDLVQVIALWTTMDAHDSAVSDTADHPAFALFEAAGIDPTHTVFSVLGVLGRS